MTEAIIYRSCQPRPAHGRTEFSAPTPSLARHVGGAVGRDALSVIVPCHRVVGKDGKLTGYAGGMRYLLELEASAAKVSSRLF